MTEPEIRSILHDLVSEFPEDMQRSQRIDVNRQAHNLYVAQKGVEELGTASICDVAGGIGLLSPGAARIGFGKSILIDDFGDEGVRDRDLDEVLTEFTEKQGWKLSPGMS